MKSLVLSFMLFPLLLCFNHLNLFALHSGRQFVLSKTRLQCIVDSLSDRRMIPHYKPDESMIEVLLARSDIEVKSWLYKAIREEKKSRDFHNSQHQLAVGFDLEWGIDKVSLIQISTASSALLIQMNYFTDKDSQASLIEILNSERILKVGVGILQDLQRLKSDFGISFQNYCDISCAAKRMNKDIAETGLRALANNYFDLNIQKFKSITMSDWDRDELDESQIQYAVYDAVMGKQIYGHLESQGAFQPERMLDIVADLVGTFFSNNDRILSRSSFYDVYMKCAESDSLMDATMGSLGSRLQQEDLKILKEAIEEDLFSLNEDKWNQFRIVLHDYAKRLGWIVEYLNEPGPDDTPYNPQQIAYIVIDGKLAGSGVSESKIGAAEIGCKVVLQELIQAVQVLVPTRDIALAFAGKLEVPKAFTDYLNSKQIYEKLKNQDAIDLKRTADREAAIKNTFFDKGNRAVWIQPRSSFKKIWQEASEIHTFIGSQLQQNDAEWFRESLQIDRELLEEHGRSYDVFGDALVLYASRLGWIVKFIYSPEIYYHPDDGRRVVFEHFSSRMCFILIDGKVVGTAIGYSNKPAKEAACKIVLQELIETIQVLVPPEDIVLAFAGRSEVPIAYTDYLNSKPTYGENERSYIVKRD